MSSRSARALIVVPVIGLTSALVVPAIAAAHHPAVSKARPTAGKWGFVSTNGTSLTASISVTKGGKKVDKISVKPVSASGCAAHTDTISGKYPITQGGNTGDTWHVGSTTTVDGRLPIKIHQGSKKLDGALYVDFTGPKAGRGEIIIGNEYAGKTRCDLYFGITAPKKHKG